MEHVGTLLLEDMVDITDPCYDKDVWCRMTTNCQKGIYEGYVELSDEGDWGTRVKSLSIYKDGNIVPVEIMERIGDICVDAGLAGFFNNKPDFSDSEWEKFCADIEIGKYWNLYDGIFSSSGYGDGCYNVFANKERTAFTIVFLEEEDEDEDL